MSIDVYQLLNRAYQNRPIHWKNWSRRRKVLKPGADGCLRHDQIERRKKLRRKAKT